jgi:hypothetical protein
MLSVRSAISNRKVTKQIRFNASLAFATGPERSNDGAAEHHQTFTDILSTVLALDRTKVWLWDSKVPETKSDSIGKGQQKIPHLLSVVLILERTNITSMIMGLEGARNQERLCWRRSITNYCSTLLCSAVCTT